METAQTELKVQMDMLLEKQTELKKVMGKLACLSDDLDAKQTEKKVKLEYMRPKNCSVCG